MTSSASVDDQSNRDRLTRSERHNLMASIGSKNTRPEILVRSAAHGLGLRFRLHRRDLPGSPDMVLPRHRTALFVHGCFWHRHQGCRRSSMPIRNAEFWKAKFDRNVTRDHEAKIALEAQGWRVLVIWECQTKSQSQLEYRLVQWFALQPPIGDNVSETLDIDAAETIPCPQGEAATAR